MHVLVTCKNKDDRIKNEGARVFTRFLPLQVNRDFSRCPRAAYSTVLGPIWPNFELVRDVMNVLVTCKYEGDPIKNEGARVFTTFSPLYPNGSYRLQWTPGFWSDLVQNIMHPFPLPNDASYKIKLWLAHWMRRYSSLKMFTDRHTDRQTDIRRLDWYTISSPWAFGSGELKKQKGDNSVTEIQNFAKSKYPSSSGSCVILFTRFHWIMISKTEKGDNSVMDLQNFTKS